MEAYIEGNASSYLSPVFLFLLSPLSWTPRVQFS